VLAAFHIVNFRSLAYLTWPSSSELESFTCLVGRNGAGKSTVLQALSFVSQLISGNVDDWLANRGWSPRDLTNRWSGKDNIGFLVEFRIGDEIIHWNGIYNPSRKRCSHEVLEFVDSSEPLILVSRGRLKFKGGPKGREIEMELGLTNYQGSCLSFLNISKLPQKVQEVVKILQGLRCLDTLTPERMRRRTKSATDIGHGGENLSAYLASLTQTQRDHLQRDLKEFFPTVGRLQTQTLKAGWKQLKLTENFGNNSGEFTNRDLNDGMLRVLAILAECNGSDRICLFDEIENGIHPELAGQLVRYLIEKSKEKQIIVTTHNPMILNYIPDEQARKSVHLVYKDGNGATQTRLYFDSKITSDKLGLLGAGEVYVDTPLAQVECGES
jgi:predicted ATPase